MNKAELVQALAEHLDTDRKLAAAAIDGLLDVIVRAVHAGDSVSVIGFGVFERRERAARTARNPRTGQLIELPATAVPAFRPGATFRDVVSGVRRLGEPAAPSTAVPRRATASIGTVNTAVAPVPTATAVALATEPAPAVDEPAAAAARRPAKSKAKDAEKTGAEKTGAEKIVEKVKVGAKPEKAESAKKAKVQPAPKPTKAAKSAPGVKADKGKKKPKK